MVVGESVTLLQRVVFDPKLRLYQPVMTQDQSIEGLGHYYVVIMDKDTPGYVPELIAIRNEVVRAWKMQKAADLALAEAEKMAEQSNEAAATLAVTFPDAADVKRTIPFTWLTPGITGGTTNPRIIYRMSEVPDVDAAGFDFMEAVFELGTGEATAVLNHPKTTAYVVRMASHSMSQLALYDQFLNSTTSSTSNYTQVRQANHNQFISALEREIILEENLRFPNQPSVE
jgi:hypothetical protein